MRLPLLLAFVSGPALASDPTPSTSGTSTVHDLDDEDADSGVTLTADQISEVMGKNSWAVGECYSHHAFHGQTGRLTVEFHVLGDGTVSAAKVQSSDLKNKPLESCITDSVLKLRFPATNGPEQISTFPFIF